MTDKTDLRGIPADVAEIYDELFQETARAHAKWKIYRQLCAVGSDQIDLLNRTVPAFFYIVQDVLLDDIILTISRITGPQQTGRGKGARAALCTCHLTLLSLVSNSGALYFTTSRFFRHSGNSSQISLVGFQ